MAGNPPGCAFHASLCGLRENLKGLWSQAREWDSLGLPSSSVAPRRAGFHGPVRGLKPTPTITESLRDRRLTVGEDRRNGVVIPGVEMVALRRRTAQAGRFRVRPGRSRSPGPRNESKPVAVGHTWSKLVKPSQTRKTGYLQGLRFSTQVVGIKWLARFLGDSTTDGRSKLVKVGSRAGRESNRIKPNQTGFLFVIGNLEFQLGRRGFRRRSATLGIPYFERGLKTHAYHHKVAPRPRPRRVRQ